MLTNSLAAKAADTIVTYNFNDGSANWRSYWFGLRDFIYPFDSFYPVTWEPSGGVEDTGYVWSDNSRWSIDYPDSNSILAFIKYQLWDGSSQLNLQDSVVDVYLQGEELDLKGGQLYFWIVNHELDARYHYIANPIPIATNGWGRQRFVLRSDSSKWFNSWARNPSEVPSAEYVLQHVDSYGFSFRGMRYGNIVTGKLMMDELAIYTQSTPVVTWPQPADVVYGTALNTTHLNATANVPGTFAYTPPAGTILDAGAGQVLSVTFTPSDSTNYTVVSTSTSITVYVALQASFEATPLYGIAPLHVTFTNKSRGEYTSSEWSFGDGMTSLEMSPSHIYNDVGVYTVTLNLIGPQGIDIATVPGYIRVFPSGPGYFYGEWIDDSAPKTVSFKSSIPSEFSTVIWDFGDGFTSTETNPTHIYTRPGVYDVTLQVITAQGLYLIQRLNYIVVKVSLYMPFVSTLEMRSAQ